MRIDGRTSDERRKMNIFTDINKNAHGSVKISTGDTEVLCTAMLEKGVPPFLEGSGNGWLTAEYAMLPACTPMRKKRDTGKPDGRSVEIQRLIGRSLRGVCDFTGMGEYTIYIDCDVLNADGGTRTAAISGAFVALAICIDKALKNGSLSKSPIQKHVAAISAGIVENELLLDLCYVEDSAAQADMNLVASGDGIAEVQITGEKRTVSQQEFNGLMALCQKGVDEIIAIQKATLLTKEITI
ncbi:ribonuclease PH [Christensenellaceae bacterium OttesenSCG-928-K19]|nr:ribonuclease PH [Christensenellaceae bacterium OttesenSCG-928-K19]